MDGDERARPGASTGSLDQLRKAARSGLALLEARYAPNTKAATLSAASCWRCWSAWL
jgi:hypothetical protein